MNKYTMTLTTQQGTKENIIFTDPKALKMSDNSAYVQGEAVDRLAAYEALGKTPEELAAIINGNQKAIKEDHENFNFTYDDIENLPHIVGYVRKSRVNLAVNGTVQELLSILSMILTDNMAGQDPIQTLILINLLKEGCFEHLKNKRGIK